MITIQHKQDDGNNQETKQVVGVQGEQNKCVDEIVDNVRVKSMSMRIEKQIKQNKNWQFEVSNSTGSKSVKGNEEESYKEDVLLGGNNFDLNNGKIDSRIIDQVTTKNMPNFQTEFQSFVHMNTNKENVFYQTQLSQKTFLLIDKIQQFILLPNFQILKIQQLCLNLKETYKQLISQHHKQLETYKKQIRTLDIINQEQKEHIRNLKRLYRQVVLEREDMIFEGYKQGKKRQEQKNNSKQEITLLKTMIHKIRPVQSKVDFNRKDSLNIKTQTRSEIQPSQSQDDQLLLFDKSQATLVKKVNNNNLNSLKSSTIQQNPRKNSSSQLQSQFYFQLQKSDSSLRLTIQKLRQRIQQLQFQLKIKDQTLLAINNFIYQQSNDLNIKDKSNVLQILQKQQIRQKVNIILKLAEQNAYLKKCMQKLSNSDMFWQKFETPEGHRKQQNNNKCLLF